MMEVSDRIGVMYNGQLVAVMPRAEADLETTRRPHARRGETPATGSRRDPSGTGSRPAFAPLLTSLAAIVAALILGGMFLAMRGKDALAAYGMLFSRGLGTSYGITETFIRMAPLLIVSAGLLISLRAGVWNIGIDGQFMVGALLAGVAGAAVAGQVAEPGDVGDRGARRHASAGCSGRSFPACCGCAGV